MVDEKNDGGKVDAVPSRPKPTIDRCRDAWRRYANASDKLRAQVAGARLDSRPARPMPERSAFERVSALLDVALRLDAKERRERQDVPRQPGGSVDVNAALRLCDEADDHAEDPRPETMAILRRVAATVRAIVAEYDRLCLVFQMPNATDFERGRHAERAGWSKVFDDARTALGCPPGHSLETWMLDVRAMANRAVSIDAEWQRATGCASPREASGALTSRAMTIAQRDRTIADLLDGRYPALEEIVAAERTECGTTVARLRQSNRDHDIADERRAWQAATGLPTPERAAEHRAGEEVTVTTAFENGRGMGARDERDACARICEDEYSDLAAWRIRARST